MQKLLVLIFHNKNLKLNSGWLYLYFFFTKPMPLPTLTSLAEISFLLTQIYYLMLPLKVNIKIKYAILKKKHVLLYATLDCFHVNVT